MEIDEKSPLKRRNGVKGILTVGLRLTSQNAEIHTANFRAKSCKILFVAFLFLRALALIAALSCVIRFVLRFRASGCEARVAYVFSTKTTKLESKRREETGQRNNIIDVDANRINNHVPLLRTNKQSRINSLHSRQSRSSQWEENNCGVDRALGLARHGAAS